VEKGRNGVQSLPQIPDLTDLLQTLSTTEPFLLPSPSVTSALENASPTDIVELSDAAMQQ